MKSKPFKQMTSFDIKTRIERIGGWGWVTVNDYKRFSNQGVLILEVLIQKHRFGGATRSLLEKTSGSRRVASRIDELRDDWNITSLKHKGTGEAIYLLKGKRSEPREKKPHCSTCNCFSTANKIPAGQIGMNI